MSSDIANLFKQAEHMSPADLDRKVAELTSPQGIAKRGLAWGEEIGRFWGNFKARAEKQTMDKNITGLVMASQVMVTGADTTLKLMVNTVVAQIALLPAFQARKAGADLTWDLSTVTEGDLVNETMQFVYDGVFLGTVTRTSSIGDPRDAMTIGFAMTMADIADDIAGKARVQA